MAENLKQSKHSVLKCLGYNLFWGSKAGKLAIRSFYPWENIGWYFEYGSFCIDIHIISKKMIDTQHKLVCTLFNMALCFSIMPWNFGHHLTTSLLFISVWSRKYEKSSSKNYQVCLKSLFSLLYSSMGYFDMQVFTISFDFTFIYQHTCRNMRKPVQGFSTQSNSKQPAQLQRQARIMIIRLRQV